MTKYIPDLVAERLAKLSRDHGVSQADILAGSILNYGAAVAAEIAKKQAALRQLTAPTPPRAKRAEGGGR